MKMEGRHESFKKDQNVTSMPAFVVKDQETGQRTGRLDSAGY
jgi:hypothetical protein